MQPTTFARAKKILADHTGKSLIGDGPWLANKVNEIRRAEWKNEAARFLKFKANGCVPVECFDDPCANCRRTYTGITLPQNVVGLHYLEARGRRIDMTNERLGSNGCCSDCGCLKAETLIQRSPLERDLPRGYKGVVVFQGKQAEDKGKRIGVEYVMHSGAIQREDIAVSLSGIETKYSPLRFNMVTFPDRCGWIEAKTQEGYSLGAYHPSITAPAHYRVRLTGVSRGDLVQWEGFKEPHDAIFETDLVEWDDPLDWINLYMWLDLHKKTVKSAPEQQAYVACATLARAGAESELSAKQPIPSATLRPRGPQTVRRQIRRANRW